MDLKGKVLWRDPILSTHHFFGLAPPATCYSYCLPVAHLLPVHNLLKKYPNMWDQPFRFPARTLNMKAVWPLQTLLAPFSTVCMVGASDLFKKLRAERDGVPCAALDPIWRAYNLFGGRWHPTQI